MDPVRAAMEVNYFGVVEVTRATMPHLRASKGRLVTVTSVGGVVGQPFNEAYCAAKFAVEGFMEALAPVAATVGVPRDAWSSPARWPASSSPASGWTSRRWWPRRARTARRSRAYIDRARQSFGNAQSAEEAAATVVEVLQAENPPFRVQTSEWARGFVAGKLADTDGSAVQAMMAQWVGSA